MLSENPLTYFFFIALPAIAAGLSSLFASWIYAKLREDRPKDIKITAYLAALSTLMGGICSHYRLMVFGRSLTNNMLVMSLVAGFVTLTCLLIRRFTPGVRD
jgi:hypothetical protein